MIDNEDNDKKDKKKSKTRIEKEEIEKILKALDKRIYEHDDSRKAVQDKFREICVNLRKHVDDLEEYVNKNLEDKFIKEDERLQNALSDLRNGSGDEDVFKKAKSVYLVKQTYDVVKSGNSKLSRMYELEVKKEQLEDDAEEEKMTEEQQLIEALDARLVEHDDNRRAVQDKNHDICEKLRGHIDELEGNLDNESEERFAIEDNCIQEAFNDLKMFVLSEDEEEEEERKEDEDGKEEVDNDKDETLRELVIKAKHILLVKQTYDISKKKGVKLQNLYELKLKREVFPEWLELPKPAKLKITKFIDGCIYVTFTHFTQEELDIFKEKGVEDDISHEAILYRGDNEYGDVLSINTLDKETLSFTPDVYEAEANLTVRVRAVCQGKECDWSKQAKFPTPLFYDCCRWRDCPEDINRNAMYSLNEINKRVATMRGELYCTVTGTASVPLYKTTSWYIKIVNSMNDNGNGIYIGVTPSDINPSDGNNIKRGWYLDCYSMTLRSGKPHDYNYKEYGPRKNSGEYFRSGDSIGVVMDAKKGELSFVYDGVNLGAAYVGIPLDKPLVPCVRFRTSDDCVELDLSEVNENVNHGMAVPSNVSAKSFTWDSITLTWDEIDGASYYQFEVDESRSCDTSPTNIYTMRGLLEDALYSFRVRTVKGNEVSEWSDVVRVRVLRKAFENTIWKECPDNVDKEKKYSVDIVNPRIATKIGTRSDVSTWCTIVGNTPFPRDRIVSWEIKLLNLKKNKGYEILVGVAPETIDQNHDVNHENCGWYFECYYTKLYSEPLDGVYMSRKYKPRKKNGKFVHTGDSVGVMMDTRKGSLSFSMNETNYGVAYERIPLDKPLVPCVLLLWNDNSIELLNIKVETYDQYKKRNRKCIIS